MGLQYFSAGSFIILVVCVQDGKWIHTLIILHIMPGLCTGRGVSPHHVVVHQSRAAEEWEAARAAEYTANHVLSGFLEPMADSVLEPLVPHHRTYNINQTKLTFVFIYGTPVQVEHIVEENRSVLYATFSVSWMLGHWHCPNGPYYPDSTQPQSQAYLHHPQRRDHVPTTPMSLTTSNGMDPAAGSTHFVLLPHQVHQQGQRWGLEVHIPIQSQDEGVVSDLLLHAGVVGLRPKTVAQEVVHVHTLETGLTGGQLREVRNAGITVTSHERHWVSNHQQLNYLFDSLFRQTTQKTESSVQSL